MKLNVQSLKNFGDKLLKGASKHSPEILTGIGIAGFIGTVVLAVNATPKALQNIEENCEGEKTVKDIIKYGAKYYIPAVVTGAASTACIIGSSKINFKRNAALTTAYALSESFAKEYKDAVLEEIGPEKEKEIRTKVAEKRMEKNPIENATIIQTSERGAKFYDPYSNTYFESNVHKLNSAINQVNNMLMNELGATLTDFYFAAGLPTSKSSDLIGWRFEDSGIISLRYTAVVRNNPETDEQEAVLSMDFNREPKALY